VFPGRLSVSRAFGNAEAKLPEFGGLPNVIISVPEITCFQITNESDFLVIGCDGIFDNMANEEVIKCAWMSRDDSLKVNNIHIQCGIAVDLILKTSLLRKTLDNVTCILVAFCNFENLFNEREVIQTLPTNYENIVTVTSLNNEESFSPIKIKIALSGKKVQKLDNEIERCLKNKLKFGLKRENNENLENVFGTNKAGKEERDKSAGKAKLSSATNQLKKENTERPKNQRSNSFAINNKIESYSNTVTNTATNVKPRNNSALKMITKIDNSFKMFNVTLFNSPVYRKTFNNLPTSSSRINTVNTPNQKRENSRTSTTKQKPSHKKVNSVSNNLKTEFETLFNNIGPFNKPLQMSYNKIISKENKNKPNNAINKLTSQLKNVKQNILEKLYLNTSKGVKVNKGSSCNRNQSAGAKQVINEKLVTEDLEVPENFYACDENEKILTDDLKIANTSMNEID